LPRGHQDNQEQEAVSAPGADRGPASGADEQDRHRRQVPRGQAEAPLHVEEPPLPCLRAAILQPVRPAQEHEFPRCVAQPDPEVRSADRHCAPLLVVAGTENHPL